MSATQREHVIQFPDTPAFELDGGIAIGVPVDPAADEPPIGRCCKATLCVAAALLVALAISMITLAVLDGGRTAYSAAITAVDVAVPGKASSSPNPNAIPSLFNLTVHIKNPRRLSASCVWSGTTATVSYGGATIGAGTLPGLCAGKRDENEVVVPVWGVGAGADVTLPSALQRREAVVGVVLHMPRGKDGPPMLACSVRVGRGLSPCTS